MDIEVRTHDGLPGGSVRADWELLVEDDPDATVFHTPRYLQTWVSVLGDEVTPRIRTVHRGDRLIGLIPEGYARTGSPTGPVEVVRFLGGTEVTDYLGPVARREDRGDVVAAYLRELAHDVDWDEVVVGGLARDAGWAESFRTQASEAGLKIFSADVEDVCPRIDLSGGYEVYLDSLPGKQRHEMRRKSRKLARDAGEVRVADVAPDKVPDQLEVFFEMANETETEKARFFRKESMREFFRALAREFADDRIFRLHVLDVGARPAAATISLVWGGEWGLYNSAFDPSLRTLAPGMVLVSELIQQASREGNRVFDLLRGDEPYKYRFGAVDRPLDRLILVRG